MNERGFSLIELLVASTVFTFVVAGVSGLFVAALDLQRRATALAKIEENTQFLMESVAREIRVSAVTSGDASCDPLDPVATRQLQIEHPTNGTVTYRYEQFSGIGVITRDEAGGGAQPITSMDVNFTAFAFCVAGSGDDGRSTLVTMPMTVRSVGGRPSTAVEVSLQTSVASRDLSADLQ